MRTEPIGDLKTATNEEDRVIWDAAEVSSTAALKATGDVSTAVTAAIHGGVVLLSFYKRLRDDSGEPLSTDDARTMIHQIVDASFNIVAETYEAASFDRLKKASGENPH